MDDGIFQQPIYRGRDSLIEKNFMCSCVSIDRFIELCCLMSDNGYFFLIILILEIFLVLYFQFSLMC